MCDETLVTRIAEMANYFLDLLVGKKRKTLKVLLVTGLVVLLNLQRFVLAIMTTLRTFLRLL